MANLNLKKLVDQDILKLVLSLFKDNLEANVTDKGYLTTSQVQALIDAGGFQNEEEVKKLAAAEVAKVVANAPENFDTLLELAEWIEKHGNEYDALTELVSDKVSNDELNTTLSDYVTKSELNALEMTEAEARAIVNEVFTNPE